VSVFGGEEELDFPQCNLLLFSSVETILGDVVAKAGPEGLRVRLKGVPVANHVAPGLHGALALQLHGQDGPRCQELDHRWHEGLSGVLFVEFLRLGFAQHRQGGRPDVQICTLDFSKHHPLMEKINFWNEKTIATRQNN